jgi:hypothetical protein
VRGIGGRIEGGYAVSEGVEVVGGFGAGVGSKNRGAAGCELDTDGSANVFGCSSRDEVSPD